MMETTHWTNFDRAATSIREKTRANCPTEFNLLISLFELFSDSFDAVPQTGDGEALIARQAILSQTLNTCRVMVDLVTSGFYIQSLIPLRHVFESWLSFWYLAKYPEDAKFWLDTSWEMRPPKSETMRNRIDHPSKETKSKLGEFQKEMHRFAHIDPVAVISRLKKEGERTIIGVGVNFDTESFLACTYGIAQWIGNCLDAMSSMIPKDHPWQTRHGDSVDATRRFIDDYNKRTGGTPLPEDDGDTS
jgi:hypothetical protein